MKFKLHRCRRLLYTSDLSIWLSSTKNRKFAETYIESGPTKNDLVSRFLRTGNSLFELVIRFSHLNASTRADVIKLIRSIRYWYQWWKSPSPDLRMFLSCYVIITLTCLCIMCIYSNMFNNTWNFVFLRFDCTSTFVSARITTKNVSTIANYIPINISHVLLSTTIDAAIKSTILHAQFTTQTWHASLLFQRNGISITIHIHLRIHKPVIGIQWKSTIIGTTRREGKRFTRDTCTWCGCRACEKKRKKKKKKLEKQLCVETNDSLAR